MLSLRVVLTSSVCVCCNYNLPDLSSVRMFSVGVFLCLCIITAYHCASMWGSVHMQVATCVHTPSLCLSLCRTSFVGHLSGILVGLLYTTGPLGALMKTCAGVCVLHMTAENEILLPSNHRRTHSSLLLTLHTYSWHTSSCLTCPSNIDAMSPPPSSWHFQILCVCLLCSGPRMDPLSQADISTHIIWTEKPP